MSLFRHLFLPHHTNNQRAKILHPSALSLIIGVYAVFSLILSQFSSHLPAILGYAAQIPPDVIIRDTNAQRKANGLPELTVDSRLTAAAAQKAADMFARNYWAHVSPTGTQPWFFITQAGYAYRYAGENLARDFSDPDSVVAAWMNSPSHRENVLNNHYHDIGVAVVDGNLEGRDTTLVVQMFGTAISGKPEIAQSNTILSVKAQTETEVPSPTPEITVVPTGAVPQASVYLASTETPQNPPLSPFEITKYVSLGLLILFVLVLAVDVFVVNRGKIVRWTSKSFAHLIFIVIILIAVTTILRGKIL